MPDEKNVQPENSEEAKKKQQADDQAQAPKDDQPKSKSYAEILKGFEEIEKIFKHDQGKDK